MKKFLQKKQILLAAVALVFGLSAQAGVETKTIDFEDGEAVFTSKSRCTVSVIDEASLSSKVLYMKCAGNAQNGYSLANLNLVDLFPNIDKAETVNVKMKYWSANGSRAILFLRDATLAGIDGTDTGVAKITYGKKFAWFRVGSDKSNGFIQNSAASGDLSKLVDQWLNIDVTVNVAANTVDYTIKNSADEVVFEATGDASYSSQAGVDVPAYCSQIELWGFINNSDAFKIDDLQITVTTSDATYANYSVKYVDANGDEIAETQTREGQVGKAASLLPTDKNAIYANDKKYIYSSDDANEVSIAEDGTSKVIVTFREAATYTYTIKSNIGTTISEGTGFEGDGVNYYAPYYILKDGTLYGSPTGLSYGQGFLTLDSDEKEVTINYTADAVQNAVYYSEAENIASLEAYEDGYTQIRMSNGKVGYAAADKTVITTLDPGVYTLSSSTRAGNTTFYAGDNTILELSSSGAVSNSTGNKFVVSETTDITVSAGSDKAYFDYVLIRKISEAYEALTINSYGWSSYAPSMNVEIPAESEANVYWVSAQDGTTATLSELATGTVVSAGTGLLVKSSNGTVTFNFTAADGKELEGNKLTGALAETAVPTGGTTYVLGCVDATVGLYKYSGSTLAAGKAYMFISEGASAPQRFVFADNEATGINQTMANGQMPNGECYNLQGQKVSANFKGIVIKNGKKVVVK